MRVVFCLYFQKNDKSQWIQFYFDKESVISVIRTFGDGKENYVTKYFIQYSEDGKKWSDYTERGVKRVGGICLHRS